MTDPTHPVGDDPLVTLVRDAIDAHVDERYDEKPAYLLQHCGPGCVDGILAHLPLRAKLSEADRLRGALDDWQRYAGTLSDALLSLGHHNAAVHLDPDQYSESGLACAAPGCLAALTGSTTPTGPSLDRSWAATVAALPEGWRMSGVWPIKPTGWEAGAGGNPEKRGIGPTPEAALDALTAALTAESAGGVA